MIMVHVYAQYHGQHCTVHVQCYDIIATYSSNSKLRIPNRRNALYMALYTYDCTKFKPYNVMCRAAGTPHLRITRISWWAPKPNAPLSAKSAAYTTYFILFLATIPSPPRAQHQLVLEPYAPSTKDHVKS